MNNVTETFLYENRIQKLTPRFADWIRLNTRAKSVSTDSSLIIIFPSATVQ